MITFCIRLESPGRRRRQTKNNWGAILSFIYSPFIYGEWGGRDTGNDRRKENVEKRRKQTFGQFWARRPGVARGNDLRLGRRWQWSLDKDLIWGERKCENLILSLEKKELGSPAANGTYPSFPKEWNSSTRPPWRLAWALGHRAGHSAAEGMCSTPHPAGETHQTLGPKR